MVAPAAGPEVRSLCLPKPGFGRPKSSENRAGSAWAKAR